MSLKNRKMMYETLKASGKDIPTVLLDEFETVKPTPPKLKEPLKKVLKDGK